MIRIRVLVTQLNSLFVVETQFGQGKAYEVKWHYARFAPARHAKFQEAYPQFPVSCPDAGQFFRKV